MDCILLYTTTYIEINDELDYYSESPFFFYTLFHSNNS
jgi:hypothetical protein